MRVLRHLFDKNRAWAETLRKQDPQFFQRLSRQQTPKYTWIGCSDSRVPANQIVGLAPGEMFVHRNVANVVQQGDLNCMAVLQFAIDVLKVEHVIVCGHYGCAGIRAVQRGEEVGLARDWLLPVRQIRERQAGILAGIANERERDDRLCELNVIEQARTVCRTKVVQAAWKRGQQLAVHGWIYRLEDGLLRDLDVTVVAARETTPVYRAALSIWSRACSGR